MTHNQQLDDLRAEIEGMKVFGPSLDRDTAMLSRSDVLAAISRAQGHLTAMEALGLLVGWLQGQANDETIEVKWRRAYEDAYNHATQLQHRVRPPQAENYETHRHIWTVLGQGMKQCTMCGVIGSGASLS